MIDKKSPKHIIIQSNIVRYNEVKRANLQIPKFPKKITVIKLNNMISGIRV